MNARVFDRTDFLSRHVTNGTFRASERSYLSMGWRTPFSPATTGIFAIDKANDLHVGDAGRVESKLFSNARDQNGFSRVNAAYAFGLAGCDGSGAAKRLEDAHVR